MVKSDIRKVLIKPFKLLSGREDLNYIASGFTSHQCVEVTESIEKKLGTLETRQFKPEFYSNNVALQQNQNENQEQT